MSYTTVQRTVHRRGLHAFNTTENLATVSSSQARPIAVRQDQHQEGLEQRGVLVTNIRSDNSKEATHDTTVVWAKSVSEVPGQEMERWGLAVNTWAGFSSRGKTKLAFYQGTLDADSYQNILKNSLLPAAQGWYEDERKGGQLQ